MTNSFPHSEFPINCISPNFLVSDGWEQYPRRLGTGFFARRAEKIYYITARHCLSNDPNANINSLIAGLHIPIYLEGSTASSSDYVSFGEMVTIKHNSQDIPGNFLDLVVLSVVEPINSQKWESLLSRAAKLPPTGEWLDNFMAQSRVRDLIAAGESIEFSCIGYPYESTLTDINYPDHENEQLRIVTQSVKFTGNLSPGTYSDRLMLTNLSWVNDLNGFSGSPVFVSYPSESGCMHALAGMVVSGGACKVQFLKIGIICQAFKI